MKKSTVLAWSILGAGVILLCLHATVNVLAGKVLADKVWTPISIAVVLSFGRLLPREIWWVSAWAGFAAAAGWFAFSETWIKVNSNIPGIFGGLAGLFFIVFCFRLETMKAA